MSKKIVYIRHGSDERRNYQHDEELTSDGKKMARNLAKKLIEKYGIPDVIYYSPFYRTRQTRKYMIKEVKKYRDRLSDNHEEKNKKIKLKLDPKLGRFFTKKEKKRPDIHSSTHSKSPIIDETWEEFQSRVEIQMNDVLTNEYKIIWNITHTLVLLRIAKLQNIERNPHVEYMDTVIINL